ncbi:MFS transporter [Jiangella aurantiaca]|uniref:MFS transporter n=1 Tax=Jiangella aurantiaca TaxID=2530373 RepID=UPI00193E8176|nr:MFS transporter [Jiangella aurantiaca]
MNSETRRNTLLLAVLCAAQFVLIIDVVIVNVAIPAIQADLGIPARSLQLTGVAYTVTFGSLLILAGRLGDLFGRRRPLVTGLTVFTVASLACALAADGWQLFAARAAQGVGAALVSPNALALLVGSYHDDRERHRALGVWAAVASAGAVAGQLLGGVITEAVGWRGIFLVNLPIGAAAIVLMLRVVPATAAASGGARRRLDVTGAALLTVVLGGVSLLLADVVELPAAGLAAVAVVLAAAVVALVRTERRHPDPVVPGFLLRARPVLVANASLLLSAGALGATLYVASVVMQTSMGYGPLHTGLGFAPITVIVLLVSPQAGALIERFGAPRLLVAGAALGVAGTVVLAAGAGVADDYWTGVLPGLALLAIGSGLSYAPTFALATAVPAEQHGRASGLVNTAQEIGSAAGLATLGALAAAAASGGALVEPVVGYGGAAATLAVAGLLALTLRDGQDGGAGGSRKTTGMTRSVLDS